MNKWIKLTNKYSNGKYNYKKNTNMLQLNNVFSYSIYGNNKNSNKSSYKG